MTGRTFLILTRTFPSGYCARMKTLIRRVALACWLAGSVSSDAQTATASSAEAADFVTRAEHELTVHSVLAGRAEWINSTYLTEDTDAIAAEFGAR